MSPAQWPSGLNQLCGASHASPPAMGGRDERRPFLYAPRRIVHESTHYTRPRLGRRGARCRGVHCDRRDSGEHPEVWLQIDAQQPTWEPIVKAANAEFEKAHPGWSVDVQYQTWGTHLQKFDATLAGGNAPDVIEMGNTEMTKYMAAGAFQDLAGSLVPEPEHLARGSGRVRQVRRQALRRPVLRGLARRHLPHRPVQERRRQGPDEPRRVHRGGEEARREEQREGLLARLHRRHRLVHRDELRLRLRRARSRSASAASGRGRSHSPKAVAGLTAYKNFFTAASRASKTTDENLRSRTTSTRRVRRRR